ncbi:DUF1631 family protein [Xylophilus sp. GOD-11R]|uniref:DUF1631 family protein n=1 Tax=Xylophilus sp. GOD-11R TaxID=3089814 RepID=UPI00298D2025|nr:DUF1631 family protein [Xylophilus sp. GOD-11R]WPB58511.1 DUF1631 family protein [Xylophilus sp. GOD-11R]
MNHAAAVPPARNPLDLCIDDAVSHAGILMAELVARARRSLYEAALRPGNQGEAAAAATQARQALGDKAGFFEDQFGAALLAAMRHPQPDIADGYRDALDVSRPVLDAPLAEFSALADTAMGMTEALAGINPLTPECVVQALHAVAVAAGPSDLVGELWMRHFCQVLGFELADEYRRLSQILRGHLAPREDSVLVVDEHSVADALALLETSVERADGVARAASPSDAARRISADIATWPEMQNVPDTIRDFVLGPWSEVIAQAEAHAGNAEGPPSDPDGYLALVRPLFWSAQPTLGRADIQRLLVTVPSLLSRLRSGLQSIGYPAEQAADFFQMLDDLHGVAARAAGSSFAMRRQPRAHGAATEGLPAPLQATAVPSEDIGAPAVATVSPAAASQVLQLGAQLAAWEGGRWVRWELVWMSPKGKLLMFSTEDGEVDSLSRAGCIRRIVEQRMHVIPDIAF